MPRNVRNFWVNLSVDGRKSIVATGPVAKDGGFALDILIRENGSISKKSLRITGFNDQHTKHNEIVVTVFDNDRRQSENVVLSTPR
jgi:hypothetical protein